MSERAGEEFGGEVSGEDVVGGVHVRLSGRGVMSAMGRVEGRAKGQYRVFARARF